MGKTDDYLLFYENEPSIIGRNQNTLNEINDEYVRENGIHVVRRMSGGSAVYHDLGNLNFSFITQYKNVNLNNFLKFKEPVIRILKELGIPAEMNGRNDILASGKKFPATHSSQQANECLATARFSLTATLVKWQKP